MLSILMIGSSKMLNMSILKSHQYCQCINIHTYAYIIMSMEVQNILYMIYIYTQYVEGQTSGGTMPLFCTFLSPSPLSHYPSPPPPLLLPSPSSQSELLHQDVAQLTIEGETVNGPDGLQSPAMSAGMCFDFNKTKEHLYLVGG